MENTSYLIRAILLVFLLAAPALGVTMFAHLYNAPHLKPLGLTKENFAAFEDGYTAEKLARVDVSVRWGRDWQGRLTSDQLRQLIEASLASQTSFYHLRIEEVPGRDVAVTFNVGPNSYGPYPPGQISAGITSALMALKTTNGPER